MRQINTIVIHHSVSPRDLPLDKSLNSFDTTHKARLHPNVDSLGYHIAYHYVIAGDGSYKQTRGLDEIGYQAGQMEMNKVSIGICLTGDFDKEDPTPAQRETLNKLIVELRKTYHPIRIIGQRMVPGVVKTCPGTRFTDEMILELNKIEPEVAQPVQMSLDDPSEWAKELWDKATQEKKINGRPHDKVTVDETEILLYRYGMLKTVDNNLTRERLIVALERTK